MTALDALVDEVARVPEPDLRMARLIEGLADRIKATSNDQNVQRFARELRAAAPAIRDAVASAPVR